MTDDRLTSPLGDRREQSVPCRRCRQPTWAFQRLCEDCDEEAENG